MRFKRFINVFMVLVMSLSLISLTACKKDEDAAAELAEYTGILTKIRLGMPMTKIIGMQNNGTQLNYENDTTLWCVEKDTDIMEIKTLLPEEAMFYYVDDSFVTYYFQTKKGETDLFLNGYAEEVYCLLDRKIGEEYFLNKAKALRDFHKAEGVGSMTGTEGIDLELVTEMKYDCPSYTVTFKMVETFDTIEDVEGYYVTYYSIEVMEKTNKVSTSVAGVTTAKEE